MEDLENENLDDLLGEIEEETGDEEGVIEAIMSENDEILRHYGVGIDDPYRNPPGRGSGRYAKGSGINPNQHEGTTLAKLYSDMKKQGMTDPQIALALGFVTHTKNGDVASTTKLRAAKAIESEARKLYLKSEVPYLINEKGLSRKEVMKMLDISDGTLRNYLNEDRKIQAGKTQTVADTIKSEVDKKHYIDIGAGANYEIGDNISQTKFDTAVEMLKQQGYKQYYMKVEQSGNPGHYTTLKVLGTPDSDWGELKDDLTLIRSISSYIQDNGDGNLSVLGVEKPRSISSSRVHIRYADEQGPDGATGVDRDGMIQLRRGVDEISLGRSLYSQVRIAVDDKYYLKGVAIYADDELFPPGCDIIYNTNKASGTPPGKVFKELKTFKYGPEKGQIDWDNPFGATIMESDREQNAGGQTHYIDKDGVEKLRVINKVNDQGSYGEWRKTISPQMLSKQPPQLVEKQLKVTIDDRRAELDDIISVTQPTVRKALLESFAEDCGANASHLKAKAFPGQSTNVLISLPSLREDECFSPNYPHGETLAFVRYPHAGPSEIVVARNNLKNSEGIKTIGMNAPDAIGLHPSQYPKLSGADSDGDTAIIIPMSKTKVKSLPMFQGMEGFDSKSYKIPEDRLSVADGGTCTDPKKCIDVIKHQTMQNEMGKVTNLIADMGIFGAKPEEMVRAIKHSQVVIDAEKHKLDWKQSEKDFGIVELKKKYQGGGGASTLITRAKSEEHIPQRKPGYYKDPQTGKTTRGVNPETGELIFVETGETYKEKHETKTKGTYYVDKPRMDTVTKMDVHKDAMELLSSQTNPHPNEVLYGRFANELKSLANEARRLAVNTPKAEKSSVAAKLYSEEVKSLNEKLVKALKNAPRERQAQIISDAVFKAKVESNPEISTDKAAKKKLRGQALNQARTSVGAGKQRIEPTEREIEAIQAGALSDSKIKQILDNADMDMMRKAFTPKTSFGISSAMERRAKSLAALGYTNADIADQLGISTSSVSKIINDKR